jgi:cytochrome P450
MAEQRIRDSMQWFFDPELDAARRTATPQAAYVKAARERPIRRNPDGSVLVLRMADVNQLNRSRDVLGNGHSGGGIGAARRRLIPLDLDGPEHTKYRKLMDPLFTARKLAYLEPAIRAQASTLIDRFVERGEADVYALWCEPLPSSIFLSLMGVPQSDLESFLAFKRDQLRPDTSLPFEQMAANMRAAADRCYAYFERVIDERTATGEPGSDLLGWCLTTEVDGERLTREDVLDITYLLMIAGTDTVGASLACILCWLARHPEQRRWILADPSRWPLAIEELMRFESPVSEGTRMPMVDLELSGEKIAAGTLCHVSWAAANLDPAVFRDPLRVDLTRSPNPHIAFASGFHRCLGSHLARLDLRVALGEFHRRIPEYRLSVPPEELRFSGNPRTPDHMTLRWNWAWTMPSTT